MKVKALCAAVVFIGLNLVAGCATEQPTDNWTRWICDSQAEVLWRFVDSSQDAVDVRVGGDDIAHRLERQPSGSGAMYSDGMLTFHTKGDEGLIYRTATDDLIGRGCKAL